MDNQNSFDDNSFDDNSYYSDDKIDTFSLYSGEGGMPKIPKSLSDLSSLSEKAKQQMANFGNKKAIAAARIERRTNKFLGSQSQNSANSSKQLVANPTSKRSLKRQARQQRESDTQTQSSGPVAQTQSPYSTDPYAVTNTNTDAESTFVPFKRPNLGVYEKWVPKPVPVQAPVQKKPSAFSSFFSIPISSNKG